MREAFRWPLLSRLVSGLTVGGAILAAVGILILMLATLGDISLRSFFGTGLRGAMEFSQNVLVMVAFLTLAPAQFMGAHVRLNLVVDKLPRRWQIGINLFSLLLSLILVGLMTWYSGKEAVRSWLAGDYMFGAIPIPLGPIKMVVAVGLGLLALQFVKSLIDLNWAADMMRRRK